jgi:hypothetical protein
MLALGALLIGAGAASAFGGGWWGARAPSYQRPMYAPAAYVMPTAASPILCVPSMPPAPAPLPVAPMPRALSEAPQPLATPLPLPLRQTTEPPGNPPRAPTIIESRALSGSKQLPAGIPAGRVRVGFWNITGRDVTLTIAGQARRLAKDRALTVDLERTFAWQLDGEAAHTERVPEDERTFEVILRP